MIALTNFIAAFIFSFIGTIPPGTLNLNILQLGLERRTNIAWRFAIAASLVEYPYAWLAVKFEQLITTSPFVLENIQLITAVVMTTLGLFTLISTRKSSALKEKFNNSGFRRGILLGILNPLALPFWIGTTAYLNGQRWVDLSTPLKLHSFLLGVFTGALAFLILLAYLAKRVGNIFQQSTLIKKIPGVILLALGVYAFIRYYTLVTE